MIAMGGLLSLFHYYYSSSGFFTTFEDGGSLRDVDQSY